jgi:hypothetical protein
MRSTTKDHSLPRNSAGTCLLIADVMFQHIESVADADRVAADGQCNRPLEERSISVVPGEIAGPEHDSPVYGDHSVVNAVIRHAQPERVGWISDEECVCDGGRLARYSSVGPRTEHYKVPAEARSCKQRDQGKGKKTTAAMRPGERTATGSNRLSFWSVRAPGHWTFEDVDRDLVNMDVNHEPYCSGSRRNKDLCKSAASARAAQPNKKQNHARAFHVRLAITS